MTTTCPVDWIDDIVDWTAMTEPPAFHTRVVDHDGEDEDDDKKRSKEPIDPVVVVTRAEDFPNVASRWPTASPEERSAWFWVVGLVHMAEVDLVRLPPELRPDALGRLHEVQHDDPRSTAAQIARLVREVRAEHPEIKFKDRPRVPRADLAAHQRALAVRACRPYVGPGPEEVGFVHLAAGVLPE